MTKNKLKLNSLKVESFVTEFSNEEANNVVGGFTSIGRFCTINQVCKAKEDVPDPIFLQKL
ncbi:MAG: pinensin family lanthipeptide [Bacteroidota bacterium]